MDLSKDLYKRIISRHGTVIDLQKNPGILNDILHEMRSMEQDDYADYQKKTSSPFNVPWMDSWAANWMLHQQSAQSGQAGNEFNAVLRQLVDLKLRDRLGELRRIIGRYAAPDGGPPEPGTPPAGPQGFGFSAPPDYFRAGKSSPPPPDIYPAGLSSPTPPPDEFRKSPSPPPPPDEFRAPPPPDPEDPDASISSPSPIPPDTFRASPPPDPGEFRKSPPPPPDEFRAPPPPDPEDPDASISSPSPIPPDTFRASPPPDPGEFRKSPPPPPDEFRAPPPPDPEDPDASISSPSPIPPDTFRASPPPDPGEFRRSSPPPPDIYPAGISSPTPPPDEFRAPPPPDPEDPDASFSFSAKSSRPSFRPAGGPVTEPPDGGPPEPGVPDPPTPGPDPGPDSGVLRDNPWILYWFVSINAPLILDMIDAHLTRRLNELKMQKR